MPKTPWSTLNARATGLSTRLLARHELEELARAPNVAWLAESLARRTNVQAPDDVSTAAVELMVRRLAALRLRTLIRWAPAARSLALFEIEEDQRSLCTMMRGLLAGSAPAQRLGGLLPTRSLPERALRRLSEAGSLSQVSALLTAWQHPLAGAFTATDTPISALDASRAELAVHHEFARYAARCQRGTGGRFRDYVREIIDVMNLVTALTASARDPETDLATQFVAGGKRLDRKSFEQAAHAPGLIEAAGVLASVFPGSAIGGALRAWDGRSGLERLLLHARVTEWRKRARRAPLTCAPTVAYLLRLRLELAELQRVLWGVALHAPAPLIAEGVLA